jgi:phosphoglycerate dehydrogenase-like enzyme
VVGEGATVGVSVVRFGVGGIGVAVAATLGRMRVGVRGFGPAPNPVSHNRARAVVAMRN